MRKKEIISALTKRDDGTIELTITIPWLRVVQLYQKTLKEKAKKITLKGFRQGKAPLKLVEEKIGKQKIYEEVLKVLIPQVYLEAVQEHQLKPIVSPRVTLVDLEEEKDWQIKVVTCELPAVKLGQYQEEVKKVLVGEKIWVPGKKEASSSTQESKLSKIFQALLKTTEVQIPQILIEEETNRRLSRLIDQTNQLGLTIEQYLISVGKTSEQLKEEYQKEAEETLKLELILGAIADQEKIVVKEEEIEKMIEVAPNEKTRKALQTPSQRAFIHQLLRKQKVIDKLMKL